MPVVSRHANNINSRGKKIVKKILYKHQTSQHGPGEREN